MKYDYNNKIPISFQVEPDIINFIDQVCSTYNKKKGALINYLLQIGIDELSRKIIDKEFE